MVEFARNNTDDTVSCLQVGQQANKPLNHHLCVEIELVRKEVRRSLFGWISLLGELEPRAHKCKDILKFIDPRVGGANGCGAVIIRRLTGVCGQFIQPAKDSHEALLADAETFRRS